jgi:hypothetical protein
VPPDFNQFENAEPPAKLTGIVVLPVGTASAVAVPPPADKQPELTASPDVNEPDVSVPSATGGESESPPASSSKPDEDTTGAFTDKRVDDIAAYDGENLSPAQTSYLARQSSMLMMANAVQARRELLSQNSSSGGFNSSHTSSRLDRLKRLLHSDGDRKSHKKGETPTKDEVMAAVQCMASVKHCTYAQEKLCLRMENAFKPPHCTEDAMTANCPHSIGACKAFLIAVKKHFPDGEKDCGSACDRDGGSGDGKVDKP